MTTGLFTHEDCTRHDMGDWHPESPARLAAIMDYLKASGLLSELEEHEAVHVSREALARAHPERYLAALDKLHPPEGLSWADPDTALNIYTLDAAARAAGGVVAAVKAVLSGSSPTRSARCAHRVITPSTRRRWASASTTTSRWACTRRWRAAWSASRWWTSTCTTATARSTSSRTNRACWCARASSIPSTRIGFDLHRPNIVNTPLPDVTGGLEFRSASSADWLPALDAHAPPTGARVGGLRRARARSAARLELVEADYRWVTELIADVAARTPAGASSRCWRAATTSVRWRAASMRTCRCCARAIILRRSGPCPRPGMLCFDEHRSRAWPAPTGAHPSTPAPARENGT